MRRVLTTVTAVIALSTNSCKSTSESKLDTTVVDAKTPNAALGAGFDSLSYEVRGDCVIRTLPEVIGGPNGRSTTFEILKLESANDLLKSTNTSASASFSASFSGGKGKASFVNTISVNDYSLFVIARVNVLLNKRRMRDVTLKQSISDFIRSEGEAAFREQCGDEFIVTETLGGEFYVVIEIETKTESERQSISASLSGNYGSFNASGSFAQNLEQVMTKSSTKVYGYIAGSESSSFSLDPAAIINKVTTFPDSVSTNSVIPYEYETISYKTLPFPARATIADLSVQKDAIKQFYDHRFELRKFLNNINYILANQDQFKAEDLKIEELNLTANNLRKEINKVDLRVSTCFKDYTKCQLSADLEFPKYNLPIRQKNDVAPNPPKTVIVTSMECPGSRTETKNCGPEKFADSWEHKFVVQSLRDFKLRGNPAFYNPCISVIGKSAEKFGRPAAEQNQTEFTRAWSSPYPPNGYDQSVCEEACKKSGLQFTKEIDYRDTQYFTGIANMAEGYCSKLIQTSLGYDTCTDEFPATCEKLVVE